MPSLGIKLSDKEKEALLQREHSYIAKYGEQKKYIPGDGYFEINMNGITLQTVKPEKSISA